MTSVSMTINGPAPILLGFFMNAAIDQNCEKYIIENNLERQVEAKLQEVYDRNGLSGLPIREYSQKGNNGLGLMLLG